MDKDPNSIELRLEAGEAYVICGECGARLWSADANPNDPKDIIINCPYSHDYNLAEKYGCNPKFR